MTFNFADLATTTVNSAYTAGGTTLTPASKTGFPSSFPFDIRVNADSSGGTAELMTVTGNSGSAWTVTGAQGSPVATTASNHAVGAVITAVLDVNGLTQLPLAGDATGSANSSTIYSLAAAAILLAAGGAMAWSSSGSMSLTQTPVATAAVDAGVNGTGAVIQAQGGQSTTRDGGVGGGGASLWVASGNGGTFVGSGSTKGPGVLYLALGDAAVIEVASTTLAEPVTDDAVTLGTYGQQFASVGAYQFIMTLDAGSSTVTDVELTSFNGWPVVGMGYQASFPAQDFYIADENGYFTVDNAYAEPAFQAVPGGSSVFIFNTDNIYFEPGTNSAQNPNANVTLTYPAQSSTSSASGQVGGNILLQAQPGQPATGSGHTGGGGGSLYCKMAGGGTSGSSTAGASGYCGVENSSGTVIEEWGPTHIAQTTTITVAASGTTTLTATQLQYSRWLTSTVTLSAAATIAFGNTHLSGVINLSGITFSSQTLTLSCGTGTVAITSFSHPLWSVECDGSNHIYVGGS